MKQKIDTRSSATSISVAYLGPEATFSHEAAVSLFDESASFHGAECIEDIFKWVEKEQCHLGVVPIENSYEGSVNITLDLFNHSDLIISAEIFLRIRHHLLSHVEQIQDIKGLYSHPMPIAQCHSWIKAHLAEIPITTVSSTSFAVKKAASEPDKAAIGSRFAGQTYKLNIFQENIEDHPENMTRFFVIGKHRTTRTEKDKTSVLFRLKHEPGTLYKALGALAKRHINMTRIESRPVKVKNWEYTFFVDIEGHEEDEAVDKALKQMEAQCVFLKRLGSYPAGYEPGN